jgi:hypothetical protein
VGGQEHGKMNVDKTKMAYRIVFHFSLFFTFLFAGGVFEVRAENLSPQGIADISRPATVQIGTHIFGTVKVPSVTVDARARTVSIVPDSDKELVIDEYFTGSGFVLQESGYIATNAHVVSLNTLKQKLVSEKALSALYENALTLSDGELDDLLKEGKDGFVRSIFATLLEQSTFDLTREVRVLDPNRTSRTVMESISEGQPAEVLVESPNFLSGETDAALLKVEQLPAPALGVTLHELSVGDRVYISGYPATAERGERSSGEVTFTSGVVSAIRTTPSGKKIYQTDAKVSEGSSGGPVLNEEGKVVGMVTFQTDALERKSGDNFAFAQAIEGVSEMALASRIEPAEGVFATAFRKGFRAYVDRRCQEMEQAFGPIQEVSPFYGAQKALTSYREDCSLWQAEGVAHDTEFALWQEKFLKQRGSFWWLFLGSVVFVGAVVILILWLFRQLERDEKEIARLGKRLVEDEQEILRQQKATQQWFVEHDQASRHSTETNKPL